MSNFLLKALLFGHSTVRSNSLRRFSTTTSNQTHSFTVSYLIDSLGFSPKTALSASRHVKFDSPEKPDKAIGFFKAYGFTDTQISTLVRAQPSLLLSDIDKTILPKLEFLRAKGLSEPEIARGLSVFPTFLKASLANQIMPSYEFFRELFQSEEKTNVAFKRYPNLLASGLNNVVPNIRALREHGVPDSNTATLLRNRPQNFDARSEMFRKAVKEVAEMGFEKSSPNFILAVFARISMSESSCKSKIDAYAKWGWNEEELSRAFRVDPRCMLLSEANIDATMGFFVGEMGYEPRFMAKHPRYLFYSLEKRVVPRFSVFRALVSKGLVKEEEKMKISLLLGSSEKFFHRFVAPYKKEAPELVELFEGKANRHLSDDAETRRVSSRRLFGKSR